MKGNTMRRTTPKGIVLLLIGGIMTALKLRARKAVAPEELVVLNVEEIEESEEKTLMLKA